MFVLVSCVCLLVCGSALAQFPGATPQGAPVVDNSQPITATNYQTGDSGRSESVDNEGNVKGQYSYVDPNGKTITVKYTAGKDGFKVEGDHLPRAPVAPQAPAPQQPQFNPQQYQPQPQFNPQQYQPQPQFNPQQYQPQPQFNPQQYQPQPQFNPQQYQPQPQFNPQQYQPQPQFNPQQYQPQPQFNPQQSLFSPASTQQQFSNFPQQSQAPVSFPSSPQQPFNSGFQQQADQHRFGAGQVSVSQTPGQGYNYQFTLQ